MRLGVAVLAPLGDRVHRAIQQRPNHGVAIAFGDFAVAFQRCVSPVVEREVSGRVLGAHTEAVAYRAVQTDSQTWLTASTW